MSSRLRTFSLENFAGGLDLREGAFTRNQNRFLRLNNYRVTSGRRIQRRPPVRIFGTLPADALGIVANRGSIDYVTDPDSSHMPTIPGDGVFPTMYGMRPIWDETTQLLCGTSSRSNKKLLAWASLNGVVVALLSFTRTYYGGVTKRHVRMVVFDDFISVATQRDAWLCDAVQDPWSPFYLQTDPYATLSDGDYPHNLVSAFSKLWAPQNGGDVAFCKVGNPRRWNPLSADTVQNWGLCYCVQITPDLYRNQSSLLTLKVDVPISHVDSTNNWQGVDVQGFNTTSAGDFPMQPSDLLDDSKWGTRLNYDGTPPAGWGNFFGKYQVTGTGGTVLTVRPFNTHSDNWSYLRIRLRPPVGNSAAINWFRAQAGANDAGWLPTSSHNVGSAGSPSLNNDVTAGRNIADISIAKARMLVRHRGSSQLWSIGASPSSCALLTTSPMGAGKQDGGSVAAFVNDTVLAPTDNGVKSYSLYGDLSDGMETRDVGDPIRSIGTIQVKAATYWPYLSDYVAAATVGGVLAFLDMSYQQDGDVIGWATWTPTGISSISPNSLIAVRDRLAFVSGTTIYYFDASATTFTDSGDTGGVSFVSEAIWHFNDFKSPALNHHAQRLDLAQTGSCFVAFRYIPSQPTVETSQIAVAGTTFGKGWIPVNAWGAAIAVVVRSADPTGHELHGLHLGFRDLGR